MPLLGKIVVIKRNGADGTEFPLTASCLFGRKLECDIRIQLPQVSKEHCRIEFNENKELILTNLSSVNPTRINGEILQQSERLKHGDLITIIDRSFRFEYPPAPTPKKKRLSTPGKVETVKVLQDQQVKITPGTTEKKKFEDPTDTCLKDGSNLPVCQDQSTADQQNKASMDNSSQSPFSDLYNMVKRDLATKPVWKSAIYSNTPLSMASVDKQEVEKISSENVKPVTPKSSQKKRRSSTCKPIDGIQTENFTPEKTATIAVQREQKRRSDGVITPVSQKKTPQTTPQKFTADQIAQQIAFESPRTKSPKSRRSSISQTQEKQTTPQNLLESTEDKEPKAKPVTRTSPRASVAKRSQVQDMLQEVVATPTSDDTGNSQPYSKKHKCDDLPLPVPKRKRVSFGGQLSPELFDKRLPPNSPLRRGAAPGRRSLGFTQESHSLLRRASTIGLMGYQLEEDIAESPAKNASPKRVASPAKAPKTPSPARALKTPSPARALKTPSPAKAPRTPSPAKALKTPLSSKQSSSSKAKTPSPKNSKPSTPSSNQSTPKSAKRLSNASSKLASPSEGSLLETPTTHGRFSVSRISTPSPVFNVEKDVKEDSTPAVVKPRECVTPRATQRRSSMKASARKTPKSMLKSALNVVRSRRSGATRANLKVVSSWADIVKFGQAKPQMECGAKKTANKRTAVKQAKVTKPKTPAKKNYTSTGHADSPASIVVGKAYLRSTRLVGAAPKVVCNVALFKKDMKMDEDFTGVSEIFKTPANSRRKSAFTKTNEFPATPLGVGEITEMSEMNTPEEAGEMVVSPMSIASTTKLGRYNSEAVTRLLQDDQNGSLIDEIDESIGPSSSELCTVIPSDTHTKNKTAVVVQTPQHKPAPPECLTGVKRLMKTPRQKSDPIEDLRGKLLKTPKELKLPQEASLEGVKELFNTPKQKKTPSEEEVSGLKGLMKTPKVTNSPVMCAVALRRLVQTPKDITEQQKDLTGVKQLIKTPRQKKQAVEEDLTGIQQMMKTPKQKNTPVEEDLTGIQQMMKTPKQKKMPVEEDLTGIQQMMKTPKQKNQPVEDLVCVKTLLQTPREKEEPVKNDFRIDNLKMTPKQKRDKELESVVPTVLPLEDAGVGSKDKENIFPVDDQKNDTEEAAGLQIETKKAKTSCQVMEEVVSHELLTNVEEDVQKTPLKIICTFDVVSPTVKAPSVTSLTQEEQSNRSSPAKKARRGPQVRFAQNSQSSQEHQVALDSLSIKVAGTKEAISANSAQTVTSVRGRRGKSAIEVSENVVQSPARKSNRGRNPKELTEAPKSSQASTVDEQVTLKPRRRRKAVEDSQVGPVTELKTSAKVGVYMKSPAPVRVKRGIKGKCELEESQKLEASVEKDEVALESADLQPSAENGAPVKTTTRARRGRTTKKDLIEEASNKSPHAVVEVVESAAENEDFSKSNTKMRGRTTKKEMLKTSQVEESPKPDSIVIESDDVVGSELPESTKVQSAIETEDLGEVNLKPKKGRARKKAIPVTAQVEETPEPTSDSKVLPEENAEMSVVKSRRGRRINPVALNNEEVFDKTVETQVESQLKPEALTVRSGRGARNKQLKPQVEDTVTGQGTETSTNAALTKESVKTVRGGRATKLIDQVLDDTQEEQDKPSADSESIQQMKAPATRSARGKRAAAVKDEPEAPVKRGRRAATVEVPPPVKSSRSRKAPAKSQGVNKAAAIVKPVEETSNETKLVESVSDETPLADADSEVVVKRGRGRIAKKSKVTSKDISVSEAEEPQYNKKDEPAAKDNPTVKDHKRSVHLSVKGRGTKKQEEPEAEKPAAERNIQPVRRGRAAASVVSQLDVDPKRGQKRKEMEVIAEESPDTESLTNRKRGKAAGAVPQPAAVPGKRQRTAAAKGPEETPRTEEKPVRGRKKVTQEDVLPPAEDLLVVPTRRGTRGQKKAEADVPSAPARQLRRK